jgi:hypothetical protein
MSNLREKSNKMSAREQSKRISQGKDEAHHIGKKNNAVVQAEFFALLNLAEIKRDKKWFEKWYECKKECVKRAIYYDLCSKYGNLNHKIPK